MTVPIISSDFILLVVFITTVKGGFLFALFGLVFRCITALFPVLYTPLKIVVPVVSGCYFFVFGIDGNTATFTAFSDSVCGYLGGEDGPAGQCCMTSAV